MADIDDRDSHARDSLTRGFNARDAVVEQICHSVYSMLIFANGELSPSNNRACNSARKYTSGEKLRSDAF